MIDTQVDITYVDYRHSATYSDIQTQGLAVLKINNHNIGFFDGVIGRSFEFFDLGNKEWLLVFFKNTVFEKRIKVISSNSELAYQKNRIGLAYRVQNGQIDDAMVLLAQKLLESKSLKGSEFQETACNSFMVAVRSGFLYVTDKPGQFERAVILNGLAHAYKLIMHEVTEQVTAGILSKNDKQLLEWSDLGFKFNAAFYSKFPIKTENGEIFKFWTIFAKHWRISEINEELTRQLSSIQTLLQFEENKKLAEKYQNQTVKLTLLITSLGLLITLLSTYISHIAGWNS